MTSTKTNKKSPNIKKNNSIVITDSISLKVSSTSSFVPKLFLFLTALAGVAGFMASVISLFNLDYNYSVNLHLKETVIELPPLLLLLTGAEFIVFSLLLIFYSHAGRLIIPFLLLTGLGIYLNTDRFVHGYGIFVNTVIQNLGLVREGYTYYDIPDTVNQQECLAVFLFFLFTVTNSIICYNTYIKPKFITVFCTTFPFIEIGLYFGYAPSNKAFSLLIAFWIALLAMRTAGNHYHSNSGQPVFLRKNNMFISSGNLKNNVVEKIGLMTVVSVFSLLFLTETMLNAFSYERPLKVKMKRSEIMTVLNDMTIEDIINALSKGTNKNPSEDKSQLGNLDRLSFENQTDLTLFISDTINENMYIKGFTGGVYKDNTWYDFPEKFYRKNSYIFEEMEKLGCYPQDYAYHTNSSLINLFPDQFRNQRAFITTSFVSNPYMFTPYGILNNGEFSYIHDTNTKAENNKSYEYSFISMPDLYKDLTPVYIFQNLNYNNESFNSSEKLYRDFVHQNFTEVPDTDDINKLREIYSYIPEYDGTNLKKISDTIRHILHTSADYTLNPGKTPANTDMVYYMLTENHKGYCSYFATAAIILARISGIPARYSEGYVIVPDDIAAAELVNTYYKINIKDTRSHAWAEFYIDGFGWVPFEFTPGYDQGIISNEDPENPVLTRQVEIVTEPEPQEVPVQTEPVSEVSETTDPKQPNTVTTVSTTSAPAAPGNENTGSVSDNNNNNNNNTGKTRINPVLSFIFFLFLVLALLILSIKIIHDNKILKLENSFREKSNKSNAINIYRYICTLLLDYGISKGNMLPMDFAAYAEENTAKICSPGEITAAVSLALKCQYSSEEPSEEEINQLLKTARKIAYNIYRSRSRYEQLKFRYLKNLIK